MHFYGKKNVEVVSDCSDFVSLVNQKKRKANGDSKWDEVNKSRHQRLKYTDK